MNSVLDKNRFFYLESCCECYGLGLYITGSGSGVMIFDKSGEWVWWRPSHEVNELSDTEIEHWVAEAILQRI